MNSTSNLINDQEITRKISKLENKLISEGVTSKVLHEVQFKSNDIYHIEKLFDYILYNVVDIIKGKHLTAEKILLISHLINSPQFSNDPKITIDPKYIEVIEHHEVTENIEEFIEITGILKYISSYHDLNALLNASYNSSWDSTTKILSSNAVIAAIQQEQCGLIQVLDIVANKNFSDTQVKILNTYEVANNVSSNNYEIQSVLKSVSKHNLSSDQLQAFDTKYITGVVSHNNIDLETILKSISKYHFSQKQIDALNQVSSGECNIGTKTAEGLDHTLYNVQKYATLEKPYLAYYWNFLGCYKEPALVSENNDIITPEV